MVGSATAGFLDEKGSEKRGLRGDLGRSSTLSLFFGMDQPRGRIPRVWKPLPHSSRREGFTKGGGHTAHSAAFTECLGTPRIL